jgi:hypothetical protein
MTTKRIFCSTALLIAGLAGLSGCASDPAAQSAPPASASPAPLPTLTRPKLPPSEPTDQLQINDWMVGTVLVGGSGPCYSLITDDGTRYALHAADGTQLIKGSRVRVRTAPAKVRISCGPGELVEMTAAEPLR